MTDAREFFRFYGEGDTPPSRGSIRRALAKERFPDGVIRCENLECPLRGATTWAGRPLGFDLDHKNGVSRDNRRPNLWFLCPNCHRVYGRYAGANAKMVSYERGGFARVRERGLPHRDVHLPLEAFTVDLSELTPEQVAEITGASPYDRTNEP